MADIYGMVGGFKHQDGAEDCSRPCLFLDGKTCRKSGNPAECAKEKDEPNIGWAFEALREHDNSGRPWMFWEFDLMRNGASDDAVCRITGRGLNGVIKKRNERLIEPGHIGFEDFIKKAREVANGR